MIIVGFLLKNVIIQRLTKAVSHEFDSKLEQLKSKLIGERSLYQERWKIKRDTCLKAMSIIDRAFHNHVWHGSISNLQPLIEPLDPIEIEVSEVRVVHNELSSCCENPEIIDLFLKLVSGGNSTVPADKRNEVGGVVGMNEIEDFRQLVRKELGFGDTVVQQTDCPWVVDIFPLVRKHFKEATK